MNNMNTPMPLNTPISTNTPMPLLHQPTYGMLPPPQGIPPQNGMPQQRPMPQQLPQPQQAPPRPAPAAPIAVYNAYAQIMHISQIDTVQAGGIVTGIVLQNEAKMTMCTHAPNEIGGQHGGAEDGINAGQAKR